MADDGSRGETDLETAIDRRLASLESADYRRNSQVALEKFRAFLRRERAVDRLDDVDWQDCRAWAQALTRAARDDEMAASTAHQYYRNVRAALSWWRDNGTIDTNPALRDEATSELPEDTGGSDQQYWGVETRRALLHHTDRRVDEILDEQADQSGRAADTDALLLAARDRALAYTIAGTGVRGAEVLRHSSDDKRNGVTWGDISRDGVLTVLGKSRDREYVSLPSAVATRLERWGAVLEPASDDWPVFVQLDKASLRRGLEAQLGDVNLASDASVRDRLDVYVDEGLVPPAISTNAGRNVMKRLSEDAELDVDGEYLKPHGGRRTLGNELYEQDPVTSQETLRHKSIETTHASYRDTQAAQRRKDLDDMVDI